MSDDAAALVSKPDPQTAALAVEDNYQEPCAAECASCLGWFCGGISVGLFCGFCCCNPYKQVERGFKGIIQRFGRVRQVVNEGLYAVNPCTESLTPVDVRCQVLDLKQQSVLTKDNLAIIIDGVVYFTIIDINKAIFQVQNINQSVYQLALVALRGVFGHKLMQDCLVSREEVAQEIERIVAEKAHEWGVQINMIQITDILLPENIKNMLSSAATAEREGKAKIILAQADVESAKLMRQASDILNTSGAMQIRMLETYNKLAQNDNPKIVFMPLDGLHMSDERKE
jgi:erythrocyte band 7 integral membrane protein